MKKIFPALILLIGCQTVPPKTSQPTDSGKIEIFGVQFRDQIRTETQTSRDHLQKINESLGRALANMKTLYAAKTGQFQPSFDGMSEASTDLKNQTEAFTQAIKSLEGTAIKALSVWKSESSGLRTEDLKAQSEKSLQETREAYAENIKGLRLIDKRLKQTLPPFFNHVGFVRSKLNAKAIASLQGMAVRLQIQLENLAGETEATVKATDQFITKLQN